jgi:hypothetical protein
MTQQLMPISLNLESWGKRPSTVHNHDFTDADIYSASFHNQIIIRTEGIKFIKKMTQGVLVWLF